MELTSEQKVDVEARVEQFKTQYKALTESLQVDFGTYPKLVPSAAGMFSVVVVSQVMDTKYLPVLSPIKRDSLIVEG